MGYPAWNVYMWIWNCAVACDNGTNQFLTTGNLDGEADSSIDFLGSIVFCRRKTYLVKSDSWIYEQSLKRFHFCHIHSHESSHNRCSSINIIYIIDSRYIAVQLITRYSIQRVLGRDRVVVSLSTHKKHPVVELRTLFVVKLQTYMA